MSDNPLRNREVLLEFTQHGSIIKVTAFDTLSMTEISIQGPASAGEETLKRNALSRLQYVLKKKGILS